MAWECIFLFAGEANWVRLETELMAIDNGNTKGNNNGAMTGQFYRGVHSVMVARDFVLSSTRLVRLSTNGRDEGGFSGDLRNVIVPQALQCQPFTSYWHN